MGCAGSQPTKEPVEDEEPDEAQEKHQGRQSVVFQSREMTSKRESGWRKSAVFDTSSIGTCTKHGIAPAPGAPTGKAKINQDRGCVCWPYNGSQGQALFCVFDGHGRQGEKVSEFCMQTMPPLLEKDPKKLGSETAVAMHDAVVAMDKKLMESDIARVANSAGTTSTIVYLRGNSCWVACSGDSRAVLGSRKGKGVVATDLSNDHKPETPEEKKRIVALGGEVTPSGKNGCPPSRVWGAGGTVGLAMSRSVGDHGLRQYGVICEPEVQKFELNPCAARRGLKTLQAGLPSATNLPGCCCRARLIAAVLLRAAERAFDPRVQGERPGGRRLVHHRGVRWRVGVHRVAGGM